MASFLGLSALGKSTVADPRGLPTGDDLHTAALAWYHTPDQTHVGICLREAAASPPFAYPPCQGAHYHKNGQV